MKRLNLLLITIIFSMLLTCSNFSAVIYSPGSNAQTFTPANDTSFNNRPSYVTPELIASISSIVAIPVDLPQKALTDTFRTNAVNDNSQNLSSNTISNTTNFVETTLPGASDLVKKISAPSFILVNVTNGIIYASKNPNDKYEPAGLANLMTSYIASTMLDLNTNLKVSKTATTGIDKDASIAALYNGDNISLKDAIGSMYVKGCVDSANVVAEACSGNINNFITLMNNTSTTLGLKNTNFVNPSGINNENQTSSAYDMAMLMAKICDNQSLVDLMSVSEYTLPVVKKRGQLILYSKNSQLSKTSANYNSDVVCSRLGYNSKSLYCLASMMNYKNNKFVAVVLKAKGSQFSDTKKLFDFAKKISDEN